MRLLLTSFICLLAASFAAADEPYDNFPREIPDLDSIYAEITDRTSPFFYPRLMDEFERNDTTMKLDKYRRLYLGAMFCEDYDAYSGTRSWKSIDIMDKPMLTRVEYDSIIAKANAVLADNPFDLVEMFNLQRALRARGRTALADIWNYKIRHILLAILSTGTGADMENALYVIHPTHEYILLNALGLKATKYEFRAPYFDFIQATDADGHPVGIYFNIQTPLEEYWRKNPPE